ncbi:small acid-soluble spore protein (thioredoxin-like protein) [Evansella vedderi]|uniref:Small, acid-soluble spore protein Tlp n=1 Tax=Evansella vedderi TaxID=38282 RepID=A0ABU0A369_9BACI|nr:small acid-soluble spore protein Tlp [Evansella vedderi]MDQ0257544.1 small acid-soluble spore protein (thioredoxin-like protein) [Evansella vedderi]
MAKPDNRKNNVERLQKMVENTKENIEAAEETMHKEDLSAAEKQAIQEKNQRRHESIESFKAEIADEKSDRENGRI